MSDRLDELDSHDRGIGGQTLTADQDRAVAGETAASTGEITAPAGRRGADRRLAGETPVQRLKARLKAASDRGCVKTPFGSSELG